MYESLILFTTTIIISGVFLFFACVGIFEAISPAVVNGNLFSDGFKHEILSSGEVGVALGVGDNGIINSTSSGIACQISLSTIGLGNDLIYLSSIHMIKSNGDEIYGFDDLVIEPIQVNVIQWYYLLKRR